MRVIEKTTEFDKGFTKLRELKAKAKILYRIQKIQSDDHFGETKPVGNGISELRIHYAKGYRVYFVEKDKVLVILLAGGDKSTQIKDIQNAKKIWEEIKK